MKLVTLFKILLGKIFTYEKMLVFEIQNMPLPERICNFRMGNESIVTIRLAQSRDVHRLTEKFKKFGEGTAFKRLEKGDLCFIAEKDGDIVHYTWFALNEAYVDELERKIQVSHDYAYLYDAYTVPEYRGMGLTFKGVQIYFDYLHERGIKKTLYVISPNNLPSLRVARKVGSRVMGEVTLFGLSSSRRYRCRGQTPKDYVLLKEMFSI